MMTNSVLRQAPCSLLLAMAGSALHAQAPPAEPIYVLVSTQSPVRDMTQPQLLALYTGRTRTLPSGEVVTPLDQQRDGPVRAVFYQSLTGMDIARINSYWARLHFTGQVQAPQAVGNDAAMVQRLRSDRNAIGYVSHDPQDASVREILRLP